jgi:hypothetical protein
MSLIREKTLEASECRRSEKHLPWARCQETIKILWAPDGPTAQRIRTTWRLASQAPSGPPFSGCVRLFSGCGRLGDLPSYLQHYINRRVSVKLPQHSLPLHCCAVEKFNHSRSLFTILSSEPSFWISFGKRESCWGLVLKCYELRTRQHKKVNG